MQEHLINKILQNKEIFFYDEIQMINNNKKTSSLLYLLGVIDTIKLIKE